MKGKTHDLQDFMIAVSQQMSREYDRIRKRAAEDSGTAGDQGEENWAELLRGWLPSTYHVVTKGRILSQDGIAGPQVDVLVLRPSYPRNLLNTKLYLAAGVAAAFECKITLKGHHIEEAVKSAVEIRRLLPRRAGSPYRSLNSSLLYGLLAHSHIWKGEGSNPKDNVEERLWSADAAFVEHPREILDLLCIADLTTWISQKSPKITASTLTGYVMCTATGRNTAPTAFTPIGEMLGFLLKRLAWEDPTMRDIATYFNRVISHSGQGSLRRWNIDLKIYSKEEVDRILLQRLPGEVDAEGWASCFDPWDEWNVIGL